LTTAIEVGLLLSVVMFTKRMSDIMAVNKVLPDETDHFEAISAQEALGIHDCRQVSIFNIEGPLFFGAAQTFSQTVMDIIDFTPKVLILRMSKVPFMDLTGENRLRSIIEQFMKRGGIIFISGLNAQPETIKLAQIACSAIPVKQSVKHFCMLILLPAQNATAGFSKNVLI